MKARTCKDAMLLALALSACSTEGICKIGEEATCPSGAFCYGGEGAKAGDNGICTQLSPPKPGPTPEEEEEEPPHAHVRQACSTRMSGLSAHAVRAPLAASAGQLLFATSLGNTPANSSLYVFDTAACTPLHHVHTGAVQGPMVVLGSGLVALALGSGGPEGEGRNTPRLALVDVAKAEPGFVHSNNMDCARGHKNISLNALFDKGLALVNLGSLSAPGHWRLVAPANAGNTGRLVAYAPYATKTEERCMARADEVEMSRLNTPFLLTPVQGFGNHDDDPEAEVWREEWMTVHEKNSKVVVGTWVLDDGYAEKPEEWALMEVWETKASIASGMAAGGLDATGREQMWLSGQGLHRVFWNEAPETVLDVHWPTSPVAVDSEGQAYVVVQTGNSYELQRFANDIAQGAATECSVGDNSPCKNWQRCMGLENQAAGSPGRCQVTPLARAPAFHEAPVGSPLLGEPSGDNPAEAYVVTTSGTVLAFHAATLELLWTAALKLDIAPSAQPVLLGERLWLVGANGEVRSLRVDSQGLNRSARWPKAFRDNCNTSSLLSTPNTLPGCFE